MFHEVNQETRYWEAETYLGLNQSIAMGGDTYTILIEHMSMESLLQNNGWHSGVVVPAPFLQNPMGYTGQEHSAVQCKKSISLEGMNGFMKCRVRIPVSRIQVPPPGLYQNPCNIPTCGPYGHLFVYISFP